MSYVVQNLAWKVEGLKPSTKFVLVALCDYANKVKFTAWPSHNSIAKRTGLSISSVQRSIKCLCDLGVLSYKNRHDAKGNKQSNLYQINVNRLRELTCLPGNVVMMTPPPNQNDRRDMVTVTDKPSPRTLNITSKHGSSDDGVIGTNFDNRPITEQRMREICEELGFDVD